MISSILKKQCFGSSFRNNAVASVRGMVTCGDEHRVVSSNDGQTIVCWHPEVLFSYENSLPIPDKKPIANNSVLNVQNLESAMSVFWKKKPEVVRQELMDITYTTKHRWFPESIHKKRNRRHIEQSRPYL